jgi:hypothetical protein
MSAGTSKARLAALTKNLLVKWEHTKESWPDAKSQEFEREYIVELRAGVDKAINVIEQLDKLVSKVRSDCE